MKTWKLWSLGAFLSMVVACGDELSVHPTSIGFASEMAAGKDFDILSNMEWSIGCTSDGDWCSVTPASGSGNQTVTVNVSKNNDNADRHAFVVITAGSLIQTVAVMQPHARLAIANFSPPQAGSGDTLVISGNNFSTVLSENVVTLNGVTADVLSATETKLKIKVPSTILCTGFLRVNVAGNTATSTTPFTYVPKANVHTFAGSIQGSEAERFDQPRGIAIDRESNLYVADYNNHRIQKVTPTGVVSTLVGNTPGFEDGTGTTARFYSPSSIAMDIWGNLYLADSGNHRIRKVAPTTSSTVYVNTLAGNNTPGHADGAGSAAQFSSPESIAMDVEGNLYVADSANNCIRKVTSGGTMVSTFAGSCGTNTAGFADGTKAAARFHSPRGIAVDLEANLYVADYGNHRIRKVTPDGVVTTIAGSIAGYADGMETTALFRSPSGITIDTAHNLYVADSGNHRIRRITSWGAVGTLAGSGIQDSDDGPGNTAQFNLPHGIAIDMNGDLYVTDANHRIRKITLE
ncbi:MAG: IPT/TIG domain-containing protein [Proteobacteria bacterium]|nr:IPT/TIG domain-containing protein [Cystobacterineae bacterium]MCL2258403.1 IPT/TIG domain-containing protein [Cystobacterineae bacterium]MCL2315344.1 IPT/TIG domain-containing protein [Pseudomonadota bacterium]